MTNLWGGMPGMSVRKVREVELPGFLGHQGFAPARDGGAAVG